MLCDPFGHYFITILPLPYLCIITGIISLNIPNPPLDHKATFSPYEKLNETLPKATRGNARPCIISFPLDNLIDFFKEYTQGFKENLLLKRRHIKGRQVFNELLENNFKEYHYS